MYSRNTYIEITIQLSLIVLVAVGSILLILNRWAITLGIIGLLIVFFQIGYLANRLNATNRRMKLFFDTIENEESMLVFPEININKEQIILNRAFNRINELIAKTKHVSQQKEHFYKALLEQVPGGVVSWDETGKIRLINNAALRLLGCTYLTHIYQLEKITPHFSSLLEEASQRGSALMKVTNEWKKRQLILSTNKVILENETFTLLSLLDIDDSLNNKEDESWGRLTHVLTHEIMNSIAPIVSLSQTLTAYYETNGMPKPACLISDRTIAKTLRGLDVIKSQSSNLINFTNSYRQLSFQQMPTFKPYLFSKQLSKLTELITPELLSGNISLQTHLFPDEIELHADETLLFQVLHNLLKNAIQALEGIPDGKITLLTQVTDKVFIEVKDNGPGIPSEIIEDIFVPFFTTKTTGSGIGLSLSKQIIRRHRGELLVKSHPYKETSFIIILPV